MDFVVKRSRNVNGNLRLLTAIPRSTSTKVAVFKERSCLWQQNVTILQKRLALLRASWKRQNTATAPLYLAHALKQMAERGKIEGAYADGPVPLDVAVSYEAATHKGIQCPVAGRTDLLVVLGTARPVILTSRNETAYGKVAPIALAAYSVASARHSARAEERVERQ